MDVQTDGKVRADKVAKFVDVDSGLTFLTLSVGVGWKQGADIAKKSCVGCRLATVAEAREALKGMPPSK